MTAAAMRILYGVNGEGMGHAVRSIVIAEHLAERGHDLQFVSSGGRACGLLEGRFPGRVVKVVGLGTQMEAGGVSPFATLVTNAVRQTLASPLTHFLAALQVKRPHVVISDFEPWSAAYARLSGRPLIAVDNIHFLSRCQHPRSVVVGDRQAAALMYPIVRNMVAGANRYLVTTFASAPVVDAKTTLHLPILRKEVLGAHTSIGSHVVVYFNDMAAHGKIAGMLREVPAQFRYYGAPVAQPTIAGNVTFMPMSVGGFISDLAGCRAVIGGAGFTLMTEAIYLGKPMLAVPFGGQFEQILNSNYLGLMGYGERSRSMSAAEISRFLGRADGYRKRLAGLRHDGNREILGSIDRALEAA